MSLPKVPHPCEEVKLSDGQTVKVHGLTVGQARALRKMTDEAEADSLCIGWATDTDVAEAREWLETAPAVDVEAITQKAIDLSRIRKGAEFQGPTGNDAEVARPAE